MSPDSRFFHKSILDDNPSCLSGESTPSYLLHSDIVLPRVKEIAPHAKLIVMLRDPVARAFSQVRTIVTMTIEGGVRKGNWKGNWRPKQLLYSNELGVTIACVDCFSVRLCVYE